MNSSLSRDDFARPDRWVIGPSGYPLYERDLPGPRDRWTAIRKAEVIAAINGGLLPLDKACARYGLTLQEIATWQRTVERAGIPGLRATQTQRHRDAQQKAQQFGWAA